MQTEYIEKNTLNQNIISYCQELVMLNSLFESNLITEEEMLKIKANIILFYKNFKKCKKGIVI